MKNNHKIIIVIIILLVAAIFIYSDWENVKAGLIGDPPVIEVQK
jgi:predicted negative regulator of RcsB-dependent stress response